MREVCTTELVAARVDFLLQAPTEFPALGALPACPAILSSLSALMPAGFAMQHLQCDRHAPGEEGLGWCGGRTTTFLCPQIKPHAP